MDGSISRRKKPRNLAETGHRLSRPKIVEAIEKGMPRVRRLAPSA